MARYSRRRTLQLGGATLAAGFAGCSGGGSPNPDAGTDSYGLTVRNTLDQPHEVSVVVQPAGGDPVFDRRMTVAPDEPKSWDSVLTKPGMTNVKAEVFGGHRVFGDRFKLDTRYVNVGGDRAPNATDVIVEVYHATPPNYEKPLLAVRVDVGDVPSG